MAAPLQPKSVSTGSSPAPIAPPEKKKTLGDKFLDFFSSKKPEKKESPLTVKKAEKLQPSGLTLEEEQFLKEKLDFGPDKYIDKSRQAWALRRASSPDDYEPKTQVVLLEILLLKLKINPYLTTHSTSICSYPFEQLFNFPLRGFNEPALEVFLKAGVLLKDLPLHSLQMHKLLPLFKEALDKGADPNQLAPWASELSVLFPKAAQKISKASLLHWLVDQPYAKISDFLICLLSHPKLNVHALNPEGRTALMSALNHPADCQETISLLLKAGISQDVCDVHGRTGLFYLLMSAQPDVFKSTLNILVEYGLKLNKPVKGAFSQFAYCLELLIDFDLKNKQVDIWKKAEIASNLAIMIERGADLGKIPLTLYLALPGDIQQKLQEAQLSDAHSSESAETSSKESPGRLSESPQKGFSVSSDWLGELWLDLPGDLCQRVDADFRNPQSQKVSSFKQTLVNILHKAGLDIILSAATDDPISSSLREDFISFLRPLIDKDVHVQNPGMFESRLVAKLNEWKNKQRSAEIEKRLKPIEVDQQKVAFEQMTAKMQEVAKRAEAAAESAKVQASIAESKAKSAEHKADEADTDAHYASMAANRAHTYAMSAITGPSPHGFKH